MRRIDDQEDEVYLNAAVYGRTGSGKTSLGVTAPAPLILLSERQGMLHVRQAATRLGIPTPPVLLMGSLGDYRDVVRALHGPKDKPFRVVSGTEKAYEGDWPSTIVIDSLTDCARLVVEDIRRQAPPQPGKDGLPVDSQRFWNVLFDRIQGLVLSFRDAGVNTLFLCLADDRETGEGTARVRTVSPALPMRRLPDVLAAAVNCVGYSYRTEKRADDGSIRSVYGVLFSGPEHLMLKPCRPLRDREVPDFSVWRNAIITGLDKLPAQPVSSQEAMQGAELTSDEQPKQEAPKARERKAK